MIRAYAFKPCTDTHQGSLIFHCIGAYPDLLLEALHAIYNKRITGQIEDILKDGKRDVQSLLLEIDVRYFPVYSLDETAQSFLNLNYPEDVDRF